MKLVSLILLLAVYLSGNIAVADDGEGFYLGGSYGYTVMNGELEETDNFKKIDFDSNDSGYKLFAALRTGFFALEGGYVDLGKPSASKDGKELQVKLKGWDAFLVGNIPIGPVDIFGKLGAFFWNSESKIDASSNSSNGTDLTYGLGVALNLGKFSIRGEFESFEVDTLNTVGMYSIGFAVKL